MGQTLDHVKLGAILRLADASERSAKAAERMADNINWLINRNVTLTHENDRLQNVIRGLRGEITKLKK